MDENELTPLSEITQWEHNYIIHLCKKGRIAHKTDGIHYLVSLDDIHYHNRQVQLRKMTPANFNISLAAYLAQEIGIDTSYIQLNILMPHKVARSKKHA